MLLDCGVIPHHMAITKFYSAFELDKKAGALSGLITVNNATFFGVEGA